MKILFKNMNNSKYQTVIKKLNKICKNDQIEPNHQLLLETDLLSHPNCPTGRKDLIALLLMYQKYAIFEDLVKYNIAGNGLSVFRSLKNIKFNIINHNNNRIITSYKFIETVKFTNITLSACKAFVKQYNQCDFCGTSKSVTADHRVPQIAIPSELNYSTVKINYYNLQQAIQYFQPICRHCNDVKREICKKCINDQSINIPYRVNNSDKYIKKRSDTCVGCYWYSK